MKIDNIVEDIYRALEQPCEIPEEALQTFLDNMGEMLKARLGERQERSGLRMSSIGKCERKVYYELTGEEASEELRPETRLKFLYGDVIEELLLLLARVAGHEVTDMQKTVHLDGVPGHIDAIIDDHVVDVKSASKFGFKKFKEGTVQQDDPFGYMHQLAGYSAALDKPGAFLAMNKESGELALCKYSKGELGFQFPQKRIEKHKQNLIKSEPPTRPYEAKPDGKSGNMKLGVNCSYCDYKKECWSDANGGKGLRTFIYSNGPAFLTQVVREPKVPETKI